MNKCPDNINIKIKPPSHGWNYCDWVTEIELSEDEIDLSDEANPPPLTPFTRLLNNLETIQILPNMDSAQSSMGLLQMFPAEDEQELLWDHSTSPIGLHESSADNADTTVDDILTETLQPRTLFSAGDDCDEALEDLTTEDSIDEVFDLDPSILEVSLNGTKRFKRCGALRRKPRVDLVELSDADTDEETLQHPAKEPENVSSTYEENIPLRRPFRQQKKIDYALYNRTGRK